MATVTESVKKHDIQELEFTAISFERCTRNQKKIISYLVSLHSCTSLELATS